MHKFTPIILTFQILLFFSANLWAQRNARAVLQNNPSAVSEINVKWYSQQFVYPGGCHVYRRDEGSGWDKITTSPLKQWKEMPAVYFQKDSNLQMFTEVLKAVKPDQLNGFLLMQVMTESFLNPDFSRFAGIQFDDKTVIVGKKYQYRITYFVNATEMELAISDPLVAGPFVPLDSLTGFFVQADKKRSSIGWDAEDTRFFGANLYRSVDGGEEIRLNKNPIALSMKKDSAGKLSYPKIKIVDDSVQEQHTYSYRITGLDFFGNETRSTTTRQVLIRDMDLPSAPDGLQKKIQKLNVWLTWKNTETKDLAGFNVYRSLDDKTGFERLNSELLPPNNLLYLDQVPGTAGYYYYVTAVNSSGNEGRSDKLFADVADLFPPQVPVGLRAVADTGRIYLSWKANNEPDLEGYMIYRTIDSDNRAKFTLMNAYAIRDTFFTDSLPKNLKNRMVYRIVAIDTSLNRSDYSEPASARMPDILPPAQPFIRNAVERDHNLVVEWISNVEPDLMGYEVLRTTNIISHPYEKINEGLISRRGTRYTDHDVTPDTVYYYALVALDSTGNRSVQSHWFSGSVAANPAEDKLSVIISFKAIFNKANVRLQWETRNTSDFIGYALYNNTHGNMTKLTDIITGNKYTDSNVPQNTQYQLRLYHTNGMVVKSAWITVKQ